MKTCALPATLALITSLVVLSPGVYTAPAKVEQVALPTPNLDAPGSLMHALRDRKSTKSRIGGEIDRQTLTDLLWAAWGVNRPDVAKRTAPSAYNNQEVDLYVALEDGLYRYDATAHTLVPHREGGQYRQDTAPVTLYFVADFARAGDLSEKDKWFCAAANTGYISQNVYLFCASRGLLTCVRDGHKAEQLEASLGLRDDQHLVLYQVVGSTAD